MTSNDMYAEGIYAEGIKQYGWRNPIGVTQYDSVKKTEVYIGKLVPCSEEKCPNIEKMPNQFQKCSNCLTVYCCAECQKKDWPKHKSFCLSIQAYRSQNKRWQTLMDATPELDDDAVFEKMWKKWLHTPEIQKVIKRSKLNENDLNPYDY